MQSSVEAFFQLKIKRKQRFQVQQQFQHFEYDMNWTLMAGVYVYSKAARRASVSCSSAVLPGTLACTQAGQQEIKSHALNFNLIRIPCKTQFF